jgi:ubiquinone/menaquinone biosynthesis C-methylase UbiE
VTPGQRFARFTTDVVVRVPGAWRLFRRAMTKQFDTLAPEWDRTRVSPDRLVALNAALRDVPSPPARVLDIGTGTGSAARAAAELWPEAEVVGVDLSRGMIEEAERITDSARIRFVVGDSSALTFESGSFDLVTLNNMIPFFDEVARVVAPGGHVVIAYAMGANTPIYVPAERLRAELGRRGFDTFREVREGQGIALLAHRAEAS